MAIDEPPSRATAAPPDGTHDAKAAAGRKTARPSPMFDDAIRLIRILQLIPKNRPIDTQEFRKNSAAKDRSPDPHPAALSADDQGDAAADFAIDCDETVRPRRCR